MARLLILLLLILSFSSCEGERDYLSVALSSEMTTMDLQVSTSLSGRLIALGNVYEKLFVLDGDGNVRCELAESYELSEDSRRLTITIRDGVPFHNGKIMSANDVALSMNRYLDFYGASDGYVQDNRFEVVDERTVAIEGVASLVLFPYLLAASPQSAVIVPSETIEDGVLSEGIGTGPYKVSKWQSGEYIELERFEDYKAYSSLNNGIWGNKSANIEKIRYYFVPDAVTRRLGLESGLYDFINDVMSQDASAFEENPEIDLISSGESGMIALVFNKSRGLCVDEEFRRALSYLMDSENIMRACYGIRGYSTHADYMEAEQSGWISGKENPLKKIDLEKAEAILSSSYDGSVLRILTSNLSNMDKLALAVSQDLERAGIKTEIIAVDWASMLELRKDSSKWDIFISAFSQVPLPNLKSFLNPDFPGWIGEEELELVSKLNGAEDIDEAMRIWRDVEPVLWEAAPVYVPGHYMTEYASTTRLKGVIIQNGFFFWNAELESR